MIGLGSNRLSVCRRGGMSVTQAGRGGMEWLGVRDPIWAQWWLPYSRQAGEALKEQFPNDWVAIRTFGFENPQYVPYINQYPMIAGSMVELSNGQKVVMTSTSSSVYETDIVPNQASDELYYSFKLLNANLASGWGYEDVWSSNTNAFKCGPASGNGTFWYHNAGGYRNSGPQRSTKVGQWLTQFITKSRCGLLGIDEANLGSGAAGTWNDGKYVRLNIDTNLALTEAKMNRGGNLLIRLVPAADNVMFDVARGIAIQNTGTGSSTISIIS